MSNAPSLLEVDQLSVSFDNKAVVDRVDLRIDAGARVGLIGESGSGKSLTAAAIADITPPGAEVTGSVRHEGRELVGLHNRARHRLRSGGIALVSQDALTALNPLVRVEDQLAIPLRRRGVARRRCAAEQRDLLASVGLDDAERLLRGYPGQLSGGQRQRVLLAMALATQPSLLLADEPTTALDPTVQAEVLALLRALTTAEQPAAAQPPSLLFISHDLAVVAQLCTHVVVLRAGRVVERGPVSEIIAAPKHSYTRELLEATRSIGMPQEVS
ncbi:ABC transporter ATP-binding protein [Saccharopolyspora mangrovi]|uniref:ABC transporter ATP-binding protein n=1 Tax=Saccharopolyspora mangrovi TaxID=3082379 RepID=A0ABU6AHN2_9PSEU|nr:ABC transporter ATP-binding protein [Saccharopolyspora sp. S2-29]MEB3370936.1 ABC transporter ATP-binding protein [Saccharopolyspora sp. S2-29]